MPWHELWFYVDWLTDDAAEAQQSGFDPTRPFTGVMSPDLAAGLGVNVRKI